MSKTPNRAFLRVSLALWRRRERYRRLRRDHWQRLLDRARAGNQHPRQKLVDQRDHWTRLLAEAHAKVALRERQLGPHGHATGIDVSNNNGFVDLLAVRKGGYAFAWCKASEGTTFTDTTFAANIGRGRRAGLKVGAYHFLTSAPAAVQAAHFVERIRSVGLGPGDLLPVVDAEQDGVSFAQVGAFVDAVHRLLAIKPVIYTFPAFGGGRWPSTFGCKLWIAHFGAVRPTIPAPWQTYAAWQHSSTAKVPGVSGDCDINITDRIEELIW